MAFEQCQQNWVVSPSAILFTLESGVDVGQGINVGLQKFAKKNKVRALNKYRASEFWLFFASTISALQSFFIFFCLQIFPKFVKGRALAPGKKSKIDKSLLWTIEYFANTNHPILWTFSDPIYVVWTFYSYGHFLIHKICMDISLLWTISHMVFLHIDRKSIYNLCCLL